MNADITRTTRLPGPAAELLLEREVQALKLITAVRLALMLISSRSWKPVRERVCCRPISMPTNCYKRNISARSSVSQRCANGFLKIHSSDFIVTGCRRGSRVRVSYLMISSRKEIAERGLNWIHRKKPSTGIPSEPKIIQSGRQYRQTPT